MARFRTRRCCGTAEEDALQHLELRPIGFSDTGWIVSDAAGDGRNCAVAVIGRLQLSGHPAWLLWLFVHLLYIVEFESRVLIAIQWAFAYFTFNRGARLIVKTGNQIT